MGGTAGGFEDLPKRTERERREMKGRPHHPDCSNHPSHPGDCLFSSGMAGDKIVYLRRPEPHPNGQWIIW